MKSIDQPPQEEFHFEEIRSELIKYGEENKLRGLEGRIQRGLDPAGILAVKETREKIEKIAEALGAKTDDVIKLTNELHGGAIWDKADKLAKGEDPDIKTWMVAADITTRGKEKEGDLEEGEFIKDYKRINLLLDKAIEDPQQFAGQAKQDLIDSSKKQFLVEDGIPISKLDSGFLAMAVNDFKSGIVEDPKGLLFVGAKELNFDVLEKMGLRKEEKEDRGRRAVFYIDKDGKDVVKKLYPGFGIVLTGDKEVAKELARSGMEKTEEKFEKSNKLEKKESHAVLTIKTVENKKGRIYITFEESNVKYHMDQAWFRDRDLEDIKPGDIVEINDPGFQVHEEAEPTQFFYNTLRNIKRKN